MSVRQCEYVQQLKHLPFKIEDIPNIMEAHATVKQYAGCVHDKDKDTEPHLHLYFNFGDGGATFEDVARWLGDKPERVQKVKGRKADMLKYLTHRNCPDKYQYDDSEVFSNFDVVKEIEKSDKIANINKLIEMIDAGEIREYNRFEYIDSVTLARNHTLFKNAFKNRSEKIMNDFNRKIDVFFIYGKTGAGKTTYAKMLSKNIGNGSFYVSSSKNDTMQDYQGQDVLILDDCRDDVFEFADFLKVLDNHTASSIKSRFFNKYFLGKCIIITTTVPLHEWYKNNDEDRNQFYRRISAYIEMDENDIKTFSMKEWTRQENGKEVTSLVPIFAYKMPNPVLALYREEQKAKNDKLQALLNFSKTMVEGLEISEDFRKQFNEAFDKASEELNKGGV